ncbi:MAG: 3'(2'), 5'-bisphosphate nucleotidase [Motiliproteus sp.]|jgi:3'(2'), 5'-bisphosphate nucleotidase
MNSTSLLPHLMLIAREAGDVILNIYNRAEPLQIDQKSDNSPVTEADLAAHQLICASLARLTPEIPILSEESPDEEIQDRLQWPRYWLVDPLDGTKEFIKRNGEFTVNIALIENHRPTLGVVYAPAIQTSYAGCVRTQSTFKSQGKQRAVAFKTRSLTPFRPLSLVVSRSHNDPRIDTYVEQLRQQMPVSVTPLGSSLKLCLIAEGMADLHLRVGPTSEWDTAAAQAVLEAAGGLVCDLSGNPLEYNRKQSLINPDFMAAGDPTTDWQRCLSPAHTG